MINCKHFAYDECMVVEDYISWYRNKMCMNAFTLLKSMMSVDIYGDGFYLNDIIGDRFDLE